MDSSTYRISRTQRRKFPLFSWTHLYVKLNFLSDRGVYIKTLLTQGARRNWWVIPLMLELSFGW